MRFLAADVGNRDMGCVEMYVTDDRAPFVKVIVRPEGGGPSAGVPLDENHAAALALALQAAVAEIQARAVSR